MRSTLALSWKRLASTHRFRSRTGKRLLPDGRTGFLQMLRYAAIFLFFPAAVFWFAGCATIPSPQQRLVMADRLAAQKGWKRIRIDGSPFPLVAYLPSDRNRVRGGVLNVYMEGDGLSWRTRTRPSTDPTPVDPVALRLALLDPRRPAAYLARPGQYVPGAEGPPCDPDFWLSRRFAPQVVAAMDRAVTFLKNRTQAGAVRLVGYSGGGAIAVLVAAGRTDVKELVTVAGNLDHALWTRIHFADPLSGSLNPADSAEKIALLPQVHFVGGNDSNMPRQVADSFVARQGRAGCARVVVVPGVGHGRGWQEKWPGLLFENSPSCNKKGADAAQ